MQKSNKGHNPVMTSLNKKKKKIQARLFFMFIPCIKFQDPTCNCSSPYAKLNRQTHRRMGGSKDGQTGPNQYAPSTSLKLEGIANCPPSY